MARRGFTVTRLPGFSGIAIAVFLALYAPIAMLVVYSFNAGDSIAIWEGTSLRWYERAWANAQVKDATVRSLILATTAASVATIAMPRPGAPSGT